jgi:type III secretory pathway component EscU
MCSMSLIFSEKSVVFLRHRIKNTSKYCLWFVVLSLIVSATVDMAVKSFFGCTRCDSECLIRQYA